MLQNNFKNKLTTNALFYKDLHKNNAVSGLLSKKKVILILKKKIQYNINRSLLKIINKLDRLTGT